METEEAARVALVDLRQAVEHFIAAHEAWRFPPYVLRGYLVVHLPIDGLGPALAIICLTCGRTSFNRTDVAQKFCSHCQVFLEG